MRSNVIDIEGMAHHETERAVLFFVDGDRDNAVWLPKSLIEFDGTLGVTEIVIPEPLAIEKELV